MNELKPCPHCGESRKHLFMWPNYFTSGVACLNCGYKGPACFTKRDAIAAWNRRPDATTAEKA